ncbi:creatininase family protein [Clostridium sp. 'deep sea']|uniref:creatininase family protein n=1 Tax=Clostridium sp. 'deep sea' TaxID=2779445 RepID=UPI001896885A|nr:creatininase family protein [Clostridium sp. 'deep sea']QOR33816.1 creatininase family protein [Clostridium sp. 'deep sea']
MFLSTLNMHKFIKFQETVNTVIIPIGTFEAHGPHCPLGTDFIIPNKLVENINNELDDKIFVAPTVNYGSSWGLGVFPGTVNISNETMACYIEEIGNGFLTWGIDNIVLLNGHGGNGPALRIAAQHMADHGANVLVVNWWSDYMSDILEICESRGHAGEDETSVMLAITPEFVDMQYAPTNKNETIGKIYTADLAYKSMENAITGDATKASAEKGQKILAVVTKNIIDLLQSFMIGKFFKE